MNVYNSRSFLLILLALFILSSCAPATASPTEDVMPTVTTAAPPTPTISITNTPSITPMPGTTDTPIAQPATQSGFMAADGSRPLTFPEDLGAHPDFRTEWWYYTGNLQTTEGRHFGFELTVFRVGLVPPSVEVPATSLWSDRELYFAHFAISDIESDKFHAFQRYSRPGPGLAGAQADPYRVWLEDWKIAGQAPGVYVLQAAQQGVSLKLTLTDEMGIILHGRDGYSRKGENVTNASYYYSQPRLRAEGHVTVGGAQYPVSGLAWKDHEFSTSVLDENQIGWDWFSLQFEDGSALMLFELRERDGRTSAASSGTFITADGTAQPLQNEHFEISVLDTWRSPHTQGEYPSAWQIQIQQPDCSLNVQPWMADQEVNFPPITYWEGAVRFEGTCNGIPARGNGYIELTGYAGNLPMPSLRRYRPMARNCCFSQSNAAACISRSNLCGPG